MKLSTSAALLGVWCGTAMTTPAAFEKRVTHYDDPKNSFTGGERMTSIKAYKTETLSPTMSRANTKRIRFTYGPFDVLSFDEARKISYSGFRMDPASTVWTHMLGDFPVDISVLKSYTSITLESGKQVGISDGICNHHMFFNNLNTTVVRNSDCPDIPAVLRKDGYGALTGIFSATAEDASELYYTGPDGKLNSGFRVGEQDAIMFSGEVVNYKNTTQRIYATLDLEYIDGKTQDMLSAYGYLMSLDMCSHYQLGGKPEKALAMPKGQTKASLVSPAFGITESGYLLHGIGHLHDGGDEISLTVNGKKVCQSRANYGGSGQEFEDGGKVWKTISSMTSCDKPIRPAKGDKIVIEAKYDFDAHPARKHAGGMAGEAEIMGLMRSSFAKDP